MHKQGRGVSGRGRVALGIAIAVLALAAAVVVPPLLSGSAGNEGDILVAGNVQAPVVTIGGPSIAYPVPDFTVGIPGATTTARPAPGAAVRPASSRQPVVSGLLAAVEVVEGARVETGQVVARLDSRLLELGVDAARSALARSRAQAGVLDDTLDTLTENRATLTAARTKLERALAQALTGRATLAAQLAQLQAAIPPGAPVPTPTVPPAPPTPQQLLAQLKAALAKLDAGIAQMRAGLSQMAAGAARLDTARTQVRRGRDLMRILAQGSEVSLRVATARRAAADVTTGVSGVVAYVRPAGTVVMVGTPLVRIVPDGPVRVDTYLTSEQLARVDLGTEALVDFDSNTGPALHGRITRIGETAMLPPTSFPTSVMHATRAVLVTITLEDGARAPAGTPVDITLATD